ncbi:hypothetical protein JF535_13535 [Microbulbifer salipaludis]|uniref:DNA replication terminus site-binding protein n=1 Tax=Microbulbifer salipaludis TaxID=187980 RepID=A0ABS3E978_9GAMM|nr:hypothetical protein [Microbulbifer salipaludis]
MTVSTTDSERRRKLRAIADQLPSAMADLHRDAAALNSALEAVEHGTRRRESYLLQPLFAQEAATQLHGDFNSPHCLAGKLFAQLDYNDEAGVVDARNTLQIPGLLAVPPHIIPIAQQLNNSKHAVQQLTGEFKDLLADRATLERNERLREMLADSGYPRAHLRQCYRQILLCPDKPDAIALSWVKARKSIRKVSVQWCEKKLIQLDPLGEDTGIQYQRQILADLHPRQHLLLRQVQVQSRPNLQAAEIFYDDGDSKGERYRQIGYSAMPVLVNGADSGALPEFTRVEHNPPASRRRQRRDLKIAPQPLLPALRVHLCAAD